MLIDFKNRTLPTNNHVGFEDESEILSFIDFTWNSMIFIRFSTSFGTFCLVFPCLPPGVCNETLDDIRMSSKKFITAIVVLITSNVQQKKYGINYGINVSKYSLALVGFESCILSNISYNLKT